MVLHDTFLESISLATMSIGTAIVMVMAMLSVSEVADAIAASSGGVSSAVGRNMQQVQESCFDDTFSLLGTGVNDMHHIDSPWNDDNCDVFLDRSLQIDSNEQSFSEMTFSLVPNGLEALFPEHVGPTVSIPIEGTNVDYKALGFRVLVSDDTQFSAELQILHELENHEIVAPLFWVYGFSMETMPNANEETNALDDAILNILKEWQIAVDLLEASCNTEAPQEIEMDFSVVGRGDEQDFGNNPIRNLAAQAESFAALYDFSVSNSYYSFEQNACNDETVLWNLVSVPVGISEDELDTMKTLLESFDPNCQPVSTDPVRVAKNSLAREDTIATVTKVCPASFDEVSNLSGSFSPGMVLSILVPLAIMIL